MELLLPHCTYEHSQTMRRPSRAGNRGQLRFGSKRPARRSQNETVVRGETGKPPPENQSTRILSRDRGRYEFYTPRTRKWFLEPEIRPFWTDAEDEALGVDGNWHTSNKATI